VLTALMLGPVLLAVDDGVAELAEERHGEEWEWEGKRATTSWPASPLRRAAGDCAAPDCPFRAGSVLQAPVDVALHIRPRSIGRPAPREGSNAEICIDR
jgi:hypothetical protein